MVADRILCHSATGCVAGPVGCRECGLCEAAEGQVRLSSLTLARPLPLYRSCYDSVANPGLPEFLHISVTWSRWVIELCTHPDRPDAERTDPGGQGHGMLDGHAIDSSEPAELRYKGVCWMGRDAQGIGGHGTAFSPDGISSSAFPGNPVVRTANSGDSVCCASLRDWLSRMTARWCRSAASRRRS